MKIPSKVLGLTVTPYITNIAPTSGVVTTAVTITGTSFEAAQGTGGVKLNSDVMPIISWSNTSIVCTVPVGAVDGNIVVTTNSGEVSNGVAFDVLFAPIITDINPPLAGATNEVIITGVYFEAVQGSSAVMFNGVNAGVATSWSDTSIAIDVPVGATTGNVVITVNGLVSIGYAFTVVDVALVTSITPAYGVNNSNVDVVIVGNNFVSITTIELKKTGETTIAATGIVVISLTQITCTFILMAEVAVPGLWDVVATNPGVGYSTLDDGFEIAGEVIISRITCAHDPEVN